MKRTVLVADDDPVFRDLVSTVLSGAGYDVLAAEDGARAWEQLERRGADLAVLDWNMPGVDGLELMRRIRAHPAHARMPILMLTVRSVAEEQVKGYERGADDYLTKPFDNGMLLARLKVLERRILDKKQ